MNILDAMTALNGGKKVRLRSWPNGVYLYLKYGQIFGENDKPDFDTIFINNRTLHEDWEEYKESILTNKERDYLSAVIKPFRNRVLLVTKIGFANFEFISISILGEPNPLVLPKFKESTLYKSMTLDKEYTLEELGL